jgi:hypothetical protein
MHPVILLLYLIRRLLQISASLCHLQGASHVLVNYLKAETFMLFVIYCECWWPVCTGCCLSVCYIVQLWPVCTGCCRSVCYIVQLWPVCTCCRSVCYVVQLWPVCTCCCRSVCYIVQLWPVCTCCRSVCYVVQLSAYASQSDLHCFGDCTLFWFWLYLNLWITPLTYESPGWRFQVSGLPACCGLWGGMGSRNL